MESRIRFSMISLLIIAFALFHSGEARKCYVCNSGESKTCENEPKESEAKNCTGSADHCMVCDGKLDNDDSFTVRGCLDVASFAKLDTMHCTFCHEDLCNGSIQLSISMVALGGLILLWANRFVLADF